MQINIYNSASANEYSATFGSWIGKLDIYYDANFLSCDAQIQNGSFEIFTVSNKNDVFIYPYIKLPIPGYSQSFDITSPYGYAGPFCTSTELFCEAEKLFTDYIFQQGCITEFVRYHYIYNDNVFFKHNIQNSHNRDIVVADLSKGWDNLWNEQYSATNRNLIRRLKRDGYKVNFSKHEECVSAFIDLYEITMKNAAADDFFLFKRDFFFDLFNKLESKIGLISVVKDEHIYASSLFFNSGKILTYYLSARDINCSKIAASNLMLSEIAKFGLDNGLSIFNLGGGMTHNSENTLFKFKKNFSTNIKKFYIGKRIHSPKIYNQIKQEYISKHGYDMFEQKKHLLQFYRN